MSTGITDVEVCRSRAAQFEVDVRDLLEIGNQWYAVAAFYAAYQMVRSALIEDPVFNDLARLHTFDVNLQPADRFAHAHVARRGVGTNPAPGVNDLVRKLYPSVRVQYLRLHSASVAVRYEVGLAAYQSADLLADLAAIRSAVELGLRA